ncbi:DUF397 domain-containing protein [Streptomyces sp. NPDC020298]|uniref:DUF397 domain-containing protein n=1 Tax=unclassified Streptomyces TaxID=2593676 RepID=UPI00340F3B31
MSSALRWQKSSYSAGDSDNDCLEIAASSTTLHLRESDDPATILTPGAGALHALLRSLHWQKSSFSGGDADTNCLEMAAATPTTPRLRESDTPATVLTPAPTALHALLTALKQ